MPGLDISKTIGSGKIPSVYDKLASFDNKSPKISLHDLTCVIGIPPGC